MFKKNYIYNAQQGNVIPSKWNLAAYTTRDIPLQYVEKNWLQQPVFIL